MNNMPLVSVIMPAYNSRLYIAAAIESVLEQDYEALELIVVDDGSSDGTPTEVRRFGERVRIIEQENAGPATARNTGVSAARGDLLAFIDADDVWLPGKISAQVEYLRDHPDVGVVFGQWIRWNANPDGSFDSPPEAPAAQPGQQIVPEYSGWIYPELLLDSVVWIVSSMVRKSLWDTLGGLDGTLRIGEDYDFFLRASRHCRIDKLARTVAYYRIHSQSTTHVVRAENYEGIVITRSLKKFGASGPDGRHTPAKILRDRLFRLFFDHGYRHLRFGRSSIAAKSFRDAIVFGQRASFKAIAYLVLSLAKSLVSAGKS